MVFQGSSAAISHTGKVRSNNQDSGYAGSNLFAVADFRNAVRAVGLSDVTAQGAVTNVVVDYVYDPAVTITAPAM